MTRFDQILGQERAIEWIRQAIESNRLPHGLIFSGPEGVGKATTAHALGTWFLCEKPKGDKPCGKCDSCRMMSAGEHPDYHVIYKELIRYYDTTGTSMGIDLSVKVIRPELIAKAALKPTMGQGKVFIIRQAQLLNTAAQNAMLKTLEEPQGRTLIILLTSDLESLLPTIRSRCQTVRFGSLEPELVQKMLAERGIDAATARDGAEFAQGSPGVALKWISDGVLPLAREMRDIANQYIAARPEKVDLGEWFKSAAEEYAKKQLERDELSSKAQATREAMGIYLGLLSRFLSQAMANSPDPGKVERICSAIEAVSRSAEYLDSNVNTSLLFGDLAVKLEQYLCPLSTSR